MRPRRSASARVMGGAVSGRAGGGQHVGQQRAAQGVGPSVVFERGADGGGGQRGRGGEVEGVGAIEGDLLFGHHLVERGVERAAVGAHGAGEGEQRGAGRAGAARCAGGHGRKHAGGEAGAEQVTTDRHVHNKKWLKFPPIARELLSFSMRLAAGAEHDASLVQS